MTFIRRLRTGARKVGSAEWLGLVACVCCLPMVAFAQVKGDLNEDGKVDVSDGAILNRILSGHISPTTLSDESLADVGPVSGGVGGDGQLTAADALEMLNALSEVDVDGDGLGQFDENAIGASPFLADTDGDGLLDPDDPEPTNPGQPLPTDLRVIDGPSSVTITFTPPPGQIDSYLVHRYGSNGEYTFFVADGNATSFVDTTASSGPVYFYWIQPVSVAGAEADFVDCDITDPSNSSLWLTGAIGQVPNPYFTASADGSSVDLSWEASSAAGVVGYRIYQSPTPVPLGSTTGLVLVHTANGVGNTSHTTASLTSGTYYFRITAFTASIESRLASARQVVVVVP